LFYQNSQKSYTRRHNGKARGKGKSGKAGASVSVVRKVELATAVRNFVSGLPPPWDPPQVGDDIEVVRVYGTDRQHLQGRLGQVLGVVATGSISGNETLCTVSLGALDGDASGDPIKTTIPAHHLRVIGGRPITMKLVFYSENENHLGSLDGLERKFVHAQAEAHGFLSQSFGQGKDRRLILSRAENVFSPEDITATVAHESVPEKGANIHSGVVLNSNSRQDLFDLAKSHLPEDWAPVDECRLELCRGPLARPLSTVDRRDIAEDLKAQLQRLRIGTSVELTVVSLGVSDNVIAVGVIGLPALSKSPHVIVALAPGASEGAGHHIKVWKPWDSEPLVLRGVVAQWSAINPSATRAVSSTSCPAESADVVKAVSDDHGVSLPHSVQELSGTNSSASLVLGTPGNACDQGDTTSSERNFRIKTVKGAEFNIVAGAFESVGGLKIKIAGARRDIGLDSSMRLIFNGKILQDGCSLEESQLTDGSTLVAIGAVKPTT